MTEQAATPIAAIGVSYTEQTAEGAQIVFQTHFAQDTPRAEMDALIDKLALAARRQKALAALPALREHRAATLKMATRATEDLARIDAEQGFEQNGRRGARKGSMTQKVDREKAVVGIERWKADIEKIDDKIAEFEKILTGD